MSQQSEDRFKLLGQIAASLHGDPDPRPDQKTREEEKDYNIAQKREEIRSFSQDIDARKLYAKLFFAMACTWLVMITAIVLLQGFGSFWFGMFPFRLSEPIVLAVVGTTTVNVLGILYVVANYLFPKR